MAHTPQEFIDAFHTEFYPFCEAKQYGQLCICCGYV